jgi:hypothetical protein
MAEPKRGARCCALPTVEPGRRPSLRSDRLIEDRGGERLGLHYGVADFRGSEGDLG